MGFFLNLMAPAICAGCNVLGGAGIGYQYEGVGVSANWVYRQMAVTGAVDWDTLAFVASYQAVHLGRFSAGPYVGRTMNLDGKTGGNHDPAWIGGLQLQFNLGR